LPKAAGLMAGADDSRPIPAKVMSTKICRTCGEEKDTSCFYRHGVRSFRSSCKPCWDRKAQQTKTRNHRNYGVSGKAHAAKTKASRARGEHVDRWICADSRKRDKKNGLENDLDREFIREAIKDGCSYCGETELRMTLDRIDNEKGHTKDNVVPACIRCNYTRKDMPYEAWLLVAPGMRAAREARLFGTWTGRVR